MATIRDVISKVLSDCMTSKAGEYDPARVFGYGFVFLACMIFLIMTIVVYIVEHKWDGIQFTAGVVTLSGALIAVSAGIYIKRDTENTTTTEQKDVK